MMEDKVRDNYDRPIISLRISITNRCNVDCIYCHHDGMLESSDEMTPDEICQVCRIAKSLGVEKIRLSGGEPLVRRDIVEIVEKVNTLGFKDLSITTNGIYLEKYAQALKDAGLDRVNVSLDTLDPQIYKMITGADLLEKAKNGILKASEVGIYPVKINMVVMNDINTEELWDMFEFCKSNDLILQLIEIIDSDSCEDKDFNSKYHFELSEFEEKLASLADSIKVREFMQNRRKYFIDGGEIEVVHPVENSDFCSNCSRLRVTPEGKLKPCLLRNDNLVDLIQFIRDGCSEEQIKERFLQAIAKREPYYKDEE